MTEAKFEITVSHHESMTTLITPVTWAESAHLDTLQRDCVTAVVLKILDRKCKMSAEQQEALLAIYDSLSPTTNGYFEQPVHDCIEQARDHHQIEQGLLDQIHQWRVYAEATIEKPVMKAFKHRLRCELFDQAD